MILFVTFDRKLHTSIDIQKPLALVYDSTELPTGDYTNMMECQKKKVVALQLVMRLCAAERACA